MRLVQLELYYNGEFKIENTRLKPFETINEIGICGKSFVYVKCNINDIDKYKKLLIDEKILMLKQERKLINQQIKLFKERKEKYNE